MNSDRDECDDGEKSGTVSHFPAFVTKPGCGLDAEKGRSGSGSYETKIIRRRPVFGIEQTVLGKIGVDFPNQGTSTNRAMKTVCREKVVVGSFGEGSRASKIDKV